MNVWQIKIYEDHSRPHPAIICEPVHISYS